ncbi:MAG: Uma2 family endonuclease [Oscillatoria sp. PMC 1051.18]|nr:Uma2 family endonuclease [Oscillatoria sp. PMC 1050.18]MEC5032008.1 Uma2 family endonuclease [Oscillatoria sp. PMC 1051.18]
MVANQSDLTTSKIPPLENGDRLSRIEFERRYAAMPNLKKAELIEGVVYLPAALRFRSHGQPHGQIMTWLGVYQAFTPKVELGDNPTVRLDLDNAPQPDAVLMIDGGQTRISSDDYIEGAPELVVEIAASSVAYDLYDKKRAYRRNGIQEYLVWRVYDRELDCFSLEAGEYIKLEPDSDGIMRSQVFPGLWLATSQLLSGEMNEVLAILQRGLNSSEHQEFCQRLAD